MSDNGTDQAGAEPTDSAIESVTPIGGTPSQGGAGQATSEVTPESQGWKFAFGGKEYTKPEDLAKDHQELHKGFTQATQKYSKEIEAYKSISDWLSTLRKDPTRWSRFAQFVEGKDAAQVVPQTPQQATPNVDDGRINAFKAEMEGRLEVQAAELEYLKFTSAHPELSKEQLDRVVSRLVSWEDEGKKGRSFEEGYRYELAESNAAEFFKAGQKKSEDAVTKGKAASQVLGSVPASTQGQPQQKKYRDLKSPAEQMEWISKGLKAAGFKPPK